MFTLSAEEIARLRELQAQMERERQEDEASDGLSQHGDAPAQPSGSWSSSDPSSATRNRRRRNREIYELRRGISAPANPAPPLLTVARTSELAEARGIMSEACANSSSRPSTSTCIPARHTHAIQYKSGILSMNPRSGGVLAVSYTHLTLPTILLV